MANEFPEERMNLCKVLVTSQEIAEHATIAYWTWTDNPVYHLNRIDEKFKCLADLLDYDVVKRE